MNQTAEAASCLDAWYEGQQVGKLGLSPSLNPFQDGTPQAEAWERGRAGAAAVIAARSVA